MSWMLIFDAYSFSLVILSYFIRAYLKSNAQQAAGIGIYVTIMKFQEIFIGNFIVTIEWYELFQRKFPFDYISITLRLFTPSIHL